MDFDLYLFYLNNRVIFTERIHFSSFVIWVLLPLAVNYKAVAIFALGQLQFCLPDAAVADSLHRIPGRLPIIKVARNLHSVCTWIQRDEHDSVIYLIDAIVVGKLGVGICKGWFLGRFILDH